MFRSRQSATLGLAGRTTGGDSRRGRGRRGSRERRRRLWALVVSSRPWVLEGEVFLTADDQEGRKRNRRHFGLRKGQCEGVGNGMMTSVGKLPGATSDQCGSEHKMRQDSASEMWLLGRLGNRLQLRLACSAVGILRSVTNIAEKRGWRGTRGEDRLSCQSWRRKLFRRRAAAIEDTYAQELVQTDWF